MGKLTKENIDKFATEEEKKGLTEGILGRAWDSHLASAWPGGVEDYYKQKEKAKRFEKRMKKIGKQIKQYKRDHKSMSKEDIYKYGTREEIEFLKEYINLEFERKHPEIRKPGDIVIYKMKKWVVQKRIPDMADPKAFKYILSPFGGPERGQTVTVGEDDIIS